MRNRLIFRAACGLVLTAAVFALVINTHASGDAYIKGAVTRAGQPVRAAWVSVRQNGVERGSSPTGDDGRYYVGGLDNGNYEIVVSQGNRPVCQRQVRLPEESRYDIALP